MIRPPSMTMIRSETLITRSSLCSTRRIACPSALSSSSCSSTSMVSDWFIPAVGSSSTSSWGFSARARAISVRRLLA